MIIFENSEIVVLYIRLHFEHLNNCILLLEKLFLICISSILLYIKNLL